MHGASPSGLNNLWRLMVPRPPKRNNSPHAVSFKKFSLPPEELFNLPKKMNFLNHLWQKILKLFSFLRAGPDTRQNLKEREFIQETLSQLSGFPEIAIRLKQILNHKIYIEDFIQKKHADKLRALELEKKVDEVCEIATQDAQKIAQCERKSNNFRAKSLEAEIQGLHKKKSQSRLAELDEKKLALLLEEKEYLSDCQTLKNKLYGQLELAQKTLENTKLRLDDLLAEGTPDFQKPLSQMTAELHNQVQETQKLNASLAEFLKN